MKFYITVLTSMTIVMSLRGQDKDYKKYSYTQFFDLIAFEKDSIFSMSDAVISYDEKTDSLFSKSTTTYSDDEEVIGSRSKTLVIDKEIDLENVHFLSTYNQVGKDNGVINNVRFTKDVSIDNVINAYFFNCEFEGKLSSRSGNQTIRAAEKLEIDVSFESFQVEGSRLRSGVQVNYYMEDERETFRLGFYGNEIWVDTLSIFQTDFHMFGRNIFQMWMEKNKFHGQGLVSYNSIENVFNDVNENSIEGPASIRISGSQGFDRVSIHDNFFEDKVYFSIDKLAPQHLITYNQFEGKLITASVWTNYILSKGIWKPTDSDNGLHPSDNEMQYYLSRHLVENTSAHLGDKALRSLFYNYFKSKFDNENANKVYIEIKDLETKRMEFLYRENPSFNAYFTWKTNQFLKIFSEYGTRPANAILFSIYVILVFALIYLFFPNSWDSHGKNRILDRYSFFMKYMNQKAGIHEVYLEDKKEEMMSYQKFRDFIASSEESVPKFFTATALPLYKWAISGTRMSASILKSIDIMQGTWSDVPKSKRWWKGLLLIGGFMVTIVYDIGIKILNALMLSVNTFTTLGFGEIPIKGLPRYLAIIQGFIGWFMLTIFSVSLISQLLN